MKVTRVSFYLTLDRLIFELKIACNGATDDVTGLAPPLTHKVSEYGSDLIHTIHTSWLFFFIFLKRTLHAMIEERETLHRRLYYQASHRGTKEADLLLEAFARIYLPQFDSGQLAELDRLLQLQDHDILRWRLGYAHLPHEYDGPVMRLLLAFDLVSKLPEQEG